MSDRGPLAIDRGPAIRHKSDQERFSRFHGGRPKLPGRPTEESFMSRIIVFAWAAGLAVISSPASMPRKSPGRTGPSISSG